MGVVNPELFVLPYGRQSIDDEDVASVVNTLRGDWLTQGPAVKAFEERLAEVTGAKYAVAVANGTAALHIACLAAGVRRNTIGLTSTITFVASANCIRYAGGTPYLVDVDPETALMSADALESVALDLHAEGRTPRVLIPVDMTGAVPDLPRVRDLAKRLGALVIEDAAHSLGATYLHEGRKVRAASCVHADMAILSFHPVKHITTCEGGAVVTNDEALYRELSDLRTHGITKDPSRLTRNDGPWYYEQQSLGFNYRISDVQCALGSSQLKKLGVFLERRRRLASLYDQAFAADRHLSERVRPLRVPAGNTSAYHLYVVRVMARPGEELSRVAARRKALFLKLREAKIAPQVHYIPVHQQPDFVDNGFAKGAFPGADAYYAGAISLPMFPAMRDEDVTRVVDAVRDAVSLFDRGDVD